MKETLKYTLRTDRINGSGKCPLYLRYTFNRKFYNIPTGISLGLNEWDEDLQTPKLRGREALELLKKMEGIRELVCNKVEVFKKKNLRSPNTSEIKDLIKDDQVKTNNPAVDDLFKICIEKKGATASKSTKVVYRSTFERWLEFEEVNGIKLLSQMNLKTLTEFESFLRKNGLQPNTRGKYIKTIKSFLRYISMIEELPVPENYTMMKVSREDVDFETFSKDEFELLRHYVFYTKYESIHSVKPLIDITERERMIGQMFVFLCVTGLSFVDFQRIQYTDIDLSESRNGDLRCFLKIDRQKNNTLDECIIPILDNTIDLILERLSLPKELYGTDKPFQTKLKSVLQPFLKNAKKLNRNNPDFPHFFPKISNQEFNREIKQLLKKLGFTDDVRIKKRNSEGKVETLMVPKYSIISSHTGRRTYITLSIENGVRPDLLMLSTGQKKADTLNKYINKTETALSKEFSEKTQVSDRV